MSETRATIRTRVERFIGTAIAETINEAIRERHLELQRTHNWRFMEESTPISVSAGDTTFSLPANFKEEMNPEMSDSNGTGYRRMTKIIKNGIESRNTSDTGRPLMYRIWEGEGKLYAKADDDYSFPLEYYKWLTELISDNAPSGDDANFLDKLHKAIEYGAIADGFAKLKNYKGFELWEARFESKKLELVVDDMAIALANQDLRGELPG